LREKEYLLGIDIGTESARAALVDLTGRTIVSASEGYHLSVPKPGWAEQDPQTWWEATIKNIRSVIEQSGINPDQIVAVGSAGQMHAPVPIDSNGSLISNEVLLWCDKRSELQCSLLQPSLQQCDALQLTGNPVVPAWTGFKIRWLKEYQPDIYNNTYKFLSCNSYINFMLTGAIFTDLSEASGTYLFDAQRKKWSPDLCEALEIDASKLPEIISSEQVIGYITETASLITGLAPGTPVVAGGGDMMCLILGAGIASPGMACDIGGTACDVSVFVPEPLYDNRLMHLHHVAPGGWISFGILDSGAFKWFRDEFCIAEKIEAAKLGISAYDLLTEKAASVPVGSEGLTFLPYLLGERTLGTSYSRAAFFGYTPRHTIGHSTRAIMEGIVYDLRQSLDIITEKGIAIDSIRSVGGSAKSPLWNQIKADIYGYVIETLENFEGGVMGAVILAATGASVFKNTETAAKTMVRTGEIYRPDPVSVNLYNHYYSFFKELHDGMQTYYIKLNKIMKGLEEI
jgi:xylulokinase